MIARVAAWYHSELSPKLKVLDFVAIQGFHQFPVHDPADQAFSNQLIVFPFTTDCQ